MLDADLLVKGNAVLQVLYPLPPCCDSTLSGIFSETLVCTAAKRVRACSADGGNPASNRRHSMTEMG